MNFKREFVKYIRNPIIIIAISIILFSLAYQLFPGKENIIQKNPYVVEALSERRTLNQAEYEKTLKYLEDIEHNPSKIDMDYYLYCRGYAEQYSKFSSFSSFVDSLIESNDRSIKEINAYKERQSQLKYYRNYQASGIKSMIVGRIWCDLLYFSPFLFAGIYTYDKRRIGLLLAGTVNSGQPYLKAKIQVALTVSFIVYLLESALLFLFYFVNTDVISEFNLPYYYISPMTSWDLTIGQGLLWLLLVGFVQFLNLSLWMILISQSSRTSIDALLIGLAYTVGSVFVLRYLRPFYHRSVFAKIILILLGITPAGGMNVAAQHDRFLTKNILGLPFLTDYNAPLVIATVLTVFVYYCLKRNSRKCFRQDPRVSFKSKMNCLFAKLKRA